MPLSICSDTMSEISHSVPAYIQVTHCTWIPADTHGYLQVLVAANGYILWNNVNSNTPNHMQVVSCLLFASTPLITLLITLLSQWTFQSCGGVHGGCNGSWGQSEVMNKWQNKYVGNQLVVDLLLSQLELQCHVIMLTSQHGNFSTCSFFLPQHLHCNVSNGQCFSCLTTLLTAQ